MSAAAAATRPQTAVSTPYPTPAYAWYVIGVLFAVTLFSQLDRQLPALLIKPLRADFGISDTQFSLLQGYAFALFYTLAGLPFGRLVDRRSRRNLIVIGVLAWSVMTVLSAFATSFTELLLCRIGVGIGEACLAPAAYSMIADCVPPARRGRAMGVYYVSLSIGSGASLLLGSLLFRTTPAGGLEIPGLGLLAQWQLIFLAAGLPGGLLALLMFTVREPARQELQRGGTEADSVADVVRYLRLHAAVFVRVLSIPALVAVIGYGALAWAPALFDRRFGLPPAQSGVVLGLIVAGSGLAGTLVSAFLSDRWVAQQRPAARLRVALASFVLIMPGAIAWPLMPHPLACYALLACTVAGAAMAQAAIPAMVQELVPNRMRGQTTAVYLLLAGLLGIGLGPTAVALLTDHVFHDDQALPWSIVWVGGPVALLGLVMTLSGLAPYARKQAAER